MSLTVCSLLLIKIILFFNVNSQLQSILNCGDRIELPYLNNITQSNVYNFSIDITNQISLDSLDYPQVSFTFTTINITNLKVINNGDSIKIPDTALSLYFNTSVINPIIPIDPILSFITISTSILVFDCSYTDNDDPNSIFPFDITFPFNQCDSFTTPNISSIYYFNFTNNDPSNNITMTFLITSEGDITNFDFDMFVFYDFDYFRGWVTISYDQSTEVIQSAWLDDDQLFIVYTDMLPYKQFVLAIGNVNDESDASYTIDIQCSNDNNNQQLDIPIHVSQNITCGDSIQSLLLNHNERSYYRHYYSFKVEEKETFQVFRFESLCNNCSNQFWIYGYNKQENEWILNLDTVNIESTNYFNCSRNSGYCDFQYIGHENFIYYLGISNNHYSLRFMCSKTMNQIECPIMENTSYITNNSLSYEYFLHFYPFSWNYTKYNPIPTPSPINYTNYPTISPVERQLDTLIINSCGSNINSLITEIGLFPINSTEITNDFFSKDLDTQKNCLLTSTNIAEEKYLIGILSYHGGMILEGQYNLSLKCINSFPYNIDGTLQCEGLALGTVGPQEKKIYAVTLPTKQNKTVFNSCGSDFDNYLTLWSWNKTNNNWTFGSNDTCNNCGDCGTSTILTQSNLLSGNYYLEIGGIENIQQDFGQYLIEMYCSDQPPGYPVIGTIDCIDKKNSIIQGTSRYIYNFYDDDSSGDHYSFNYYSFQITQQNITSYTFKYNIKQKNGYLQIYKWNGEKWSIDKECKGIDDDTGCTSIGLTNDAVIGNYYLAVLIPSGNYTVEMVCNFDDMIESTLQKDKQIEREVIWTLIGIMTILIIIALIAFIFNHKSDFYYDDGKWYAVIEYGLQVFDFVTDINLCYELLSYVSNDYGETGQKNTYILIAAIGSLIFTLLPYMINMYKACSIKKLVRNNIVAKYYFEQNVSLFVALTMISGGIYNTLKLLSCHIFGFKIFNCGLSTYDLRKLLPLKIYSSVILENTPQLICQVMYAVSLGRITFNTAMSSATSLLSIFNALISFYIKSQSLLNSEAVIYYLQLTRDKDLNIQEKINMVKFKGLKKKLRYSIALLFGVTPSSFELNYIILTNNGCIISMVQYVFRDELKDIMTRIDNRLSSKHHHSNHHTSSSTMIMDMSTIKFVRTLYRVCSDKIIDTLCNHFDLRNDNQWTLNFHSSFPYKFEDLIMNINGGTNIIETFNLNENENSIPRLKYSQDNYVPLNNDDY